MYFISESLRPLEVNLEVASDVQNLYRSRYQPCFGIGTFNSTKSVFPVRFCTHHCCVVSFQVCVGRGSSEDSNTAVELRSGYSELLQ